MGVFVMSGSERRPVLRWFSHPDHENGVDLRFDPNGRADADPAKESCSVFTGPIPDDCRWWVEDVPEFEFTDGDGRKVTRYLRVGSDGAGPLLGEPLRPGEPAGPPAESAAKSDWVDWAVSQGADRDAANAATRADLIAQHGAVVHTEGN